LTRQARGRAPIVMGLVMTLVTSPGIAGPGPGSGPGERTYPPELNLSPQQKERLDSLSSRVRSTNRELGRRLEGRRRELNLLYDRYEMDEPRARRLRQEIHEVQGELLELHHSFQLELRKILTIEQFTRLQEARRKRRGPPWRHRRGPGGRGFGVPAGGAGRSAPA